MRILAIILLLLLFSCKENNPNHYEDNLSPPSNVSIFYLDSCEYIKLDGINNTCLIHKANCKNPEHLTINQLNNDTRSKKRN